MFKFINYRLLLISTLIVGLFSVISYLGSFAHDEGGEGFVIQFLFILFYVFAFPFLYILFALKIISWFSLSMGLIANSIFYGLLIERIKYFYKTRKRFPVDGI